MHNAHLHSLIFDLDMGKKPQLSEATKARILTMADHTSKTQLEIAQECGVSQQVVSSLLQKRRTTGSTATAKRSGRPRKTTERDDLMIRRAVVANPFATSTELRATVGASVANVSTRTIRRRLSDKFKMAARKAVKKPLITEAARKKRLSWCKRHKDWTLDEWKRVIWSDESTFLQFHDTMRTVRRPPGASPHSPAFTRKTVKHSPSIMVWGCFSFRGRGTLHFLERGQKMNTQLYTAILSEKLPRMLAQIPRAIFQQDAAPCHTSKASKAWFRDNGVEVLEWPGNSPDLNPIENLWNAMKRRVNKGNIRNLHELKSQITRAWCLEVTPQECQRLVESMPRRIQQVIRNKGYPTKY